MNPHAATAEAMLVYGGSFAQALAAAYQRADDDNQRRIREAFPELWAQYTELAVMREQRQQKGGGHVS